MSDVNLVTNLIFSILNLLPTLYFSSIVFLIPFFLFFMRKWVVPLLHKLKN